MSTETTGRRPGLAHWIPELVAALDGDPAGAGAQLRAIIAGRSARIGLDDDVVVVRSVGPGALVVVPGDDAGEAPPDGWGHTTTRTVFALLDGELELGQAIVSGDVEIRSPIDDALWMYRVIELLLDGSARVPRLRRLAAEFRSAAQPSASAEPFVDWRSGARTAELALLSRLGLLEHDRVDRDG